MDRRFLVSLKDENLILPKPSKRPGKAQLKQINRKYGMFIHFGMNTFHNLEWTDGTLPAQSYQPSSIDADQWIETAKNAGMKYVILTTKHHDGFCLWDSQYTNYDVANSGNRTNVIEEAAIACKKHHIGLGLYYSLWDRNKNPDTGNTAGDKSYNEYMINQIIELIDIVKRHTNIVEFWFDGGWAKENYRWPVMEIYQSIKSSESECQIGINWNIGLPDNVDFKEDYHSVLPHDQKEGYPIRYFPSDFRLGDPYLPSDHDPKLFSHDGKLYYMPFQTTVCSSEKWFYHTDDSTFKSVEDLERLYKIATARDNIFILNCPPDREGKLRRKDIEILMELKDRLNL